MNFEKLSSFSNIPIAESTLVICDIDDTVLYFPKKEEFVKNLVKDLLNQFSPEEAEYEAQGMMNMYHIIQKPAHTDLAGFNALLEQLDNKHGKLVFLTARQQRDDKFTRDHLTTIGIDESKFEVYYTDNQISKGEFIHKKFGKEIGSGKWNNVIFIDDCEDYIRSVWRFCPEIKCFWFAR